MPPQDRLYQCSRNGENRHRAHCERPRHDAGQHSCLRLHVGEHHAKYPEDERDDRRPNRPAIIVHSSLIPAGQMSSTPWGRNIPTACVEARSAGQPRFEEFSRANATKAREGPTMLQSRLRTAWWKVVITCQTPAKNCPALAPRATARHSTQTSVGSKASSTLLSADTPW